MTLITVRTAVVLLSMKKPVFALPDWIIPVESRGVPGLGIKSVRNVAATCCCWWWCLRHAVIQLKLGRRLQWDTDPICEETRLLSYTCLGQGQSLALVVWDLVVAGSQIKIKRKNDAHWYIFLILFLRFISGSLTYPFRRLEFNLL